MAARTNGHTLAVLFTGVLLAALDIAIVGPALPSIQRAFGVDARALAWVFNAYILVGLVAAPLLAKLSDRHGRRAIYVASLLTFGVGSLLVAVAPSFGWLLLGRCVQAAGAGGLLPVAAAVVADTFPRERRGRALGLIGAVFGVAFLLGPLLGGMLLPYGWQWLFLINLPILAVLIPASLGLPGAPVAAGRAAFDWPGAATLAMLLAALAWGLGHLGGIQEPGAAGMAGLPFLALAAAAAYVFWRAEKRAADPILDPALLRSRQLCIVGVIAAATGVVEAGMVFLPLLSVQAFAVSPSTASFMLVPLVGALIAGSLAAGRLLDKIGAKPVIQSGLLLTALGLLLFTRRPLELSGFYAAGVCVGLGLSGLLGAPLRFIALEEAGEGRRGAGQGLLTSFLSIGRIAGAALIGGAAAAGTSELAGYRHALFVLAFVALAAALASVALRAQRKRRLVGDERA